MNCNSKKYNHKDLYQILGIDKSISQQEINSLVLKTSPKDNPEVGKALMVLTEPQKRIEYDNYGWKDEWEDEWKKENAFRHSIFRAIMNHKENLINQGATTPDGFKVYVFIHEDVDPSLWAPYEGLGGWIDKIWGIFDNRGISRGWKEELEDFKSKIITALNQAYEKNKNIPFNSGYWEKVESGNCANCGKSAKLRCKSKYSDGKSYCSPECYDEGFKYRTYRSFEPNFPHQDKNHSPNKHRTPESPLSDRIKRLEKDIEHYQKKITEVPEKDREGVQDLINELEKQLKYEKMKVFFARKGSNETISEVKVNRFTGKTTRKVKSNPIAELLNWMKSEGITQISLNADGNLVIKYGTSTTTVEENNLTAEQKDIKEFFQVCGQTSFNQNELENALNNERNEQDKGKPKNNNGWIAPVAIGAGAIIIFLIGVAIYKNKKKDY